MRSFSLMPMRISAKMRISLVKVPSSDGFLRSLSLKRELYCSTNLGNEVLACHVLYLVILSGYQCLVHDVEIVLKG